MKKAILIAGWLLLTLTAVQAQQEAQFAQYFDNTIYVNPAYAGSRGMMNVTAIHREQWVGFAGRPRTSNLSVHSPLRYESVGLGLSVIADEAGPIKQNQCFADFSYRVKLTATQKLVFGVKAGVNLINIGKSSLESITDNDPKLLLNIRNNVNPNIGAGVYYHTPRYFLGISTPKILEQSYDGSDQNMERRHFFLVTGGVIPVNTEWKLRPSLQFKYTHGAPFSADISLAGIYNEKIWLGAMYRTAAAFAAFVQVQLSPQLKFGLASEFGTQKIRNYNYGTFEALLSYDFNFKKEGIRSPRYF